MTFSSLNYIFPESAIINQYEHLEIGGIDTQDLALKYGTPMYILCERTIRNRCHDFKQAFNKLHENTQILYASKAYLGPALAKIIAEEGLGLDVVSGGELAIARIAESPPSTIYLHGNNKSKTELSAALEYGVDCIVVDNLLEIHLLQELASTLGKTQSILLRVTPGIDPHTHTKTTTGIVDSKFGLNLSNGQAAEAIRQAVACPSLHLRGLHFHLGSPIFELDPYVEAMKVVLEFAASQREAGLNLEEISPGGGFAISYLQNRIAPTPSKYASAIVSSLKEGCAYHQLPLPRLTVEPGRSIIGQSGITLYTVGNIKDIPGIRTYASVDGGMGDNIRPALYEAEYEAVLATNMAKPALKHYTIAGKFCESGDILINDIKLPELISGDLIAIPATGAYSPSMSSNYNQNPRPPIILVKDNESRVIRRRETFEDLIRPDIW
ncbi:diaminopimelate decarboxylase [SAR202 cluster bacterium AD-802-E10_MRT_200m]|nr:diaminopimelate decarboxylase [SAR202 cluster bacterium AD-802-E10_MRT_200m]